MAGSINKVILVGNLGKDPEVRRMPSGSPIVNLSIATSDVWRDKATGEKKEKTEWHRVVIFNETLAKLAENYLKKGSKVYLEGALQTRKYEQNGVEKYSTEIVLQGYRGEMALLDSRGSDNSQISDSSGDDYGRGGSSSSNRQASVSNNSSHELDDDVPF